MFWNVLSELSRSPKVAIKHFERAFIILVPCLDATILFERQLVVPK